MSGRREAGLRKRREKTGRGNVFYTEAEARRAARSFGTQRNLPMQEFRCKYCPYWHIGCRRSREEQWARKRARDA